MERYTQRDRDGKAVIRGDSVYSDWGVPEGFRGDAIDRLAAYEDTGVEPEDFKKAFNEEAVLKLAAQVLGTTPDCLRELVKAQDEGLIQPMSCAGCRYDKTGDLAEYTAHCMRCIRNRYPDDRHDPAEAEEALGAGGPC